MYSPIIDSGNSSGDIEAGKVPRHESSGKLLNVDPTFTFAEAQVRQGFVRKVLGLLCFQLLITVAIALPFVTSQKVVAFMQANVWMLWTSMGLSFAFILVLACSEKARRSHPTNLILMFAFSACQGLLVGAACSTYNAQVVVIAFVITVSVVLSLVAWTFATKKDITSWGGALYTLLMVLLVAGFVQFFVRAPWLNLVICAGGALLFCIYLIFDLQLIMGNKELSISPDEYVLATLNIYLDILNIFLYILRLVGQLSNSD